MGPRAGLDGFGRITSLGPAGIRTPDRPARSKSLYRLTYPRHVNQTEAHLNAVCRTALPGTTEPQVPSRLLIFSLRPADEESSPLLMACRRKIGHDSMAPLTIMADLRRYNVKTSDLRQNGIQKYPLLSTQQSISSRSITNTNLRTQNGAHF